MAKILIIEDHDAVRMSYELTMEVAGHESIAIEAAEGFESYVDEVDLVLTDLMLPGLNGIKVAEIMRDKYPDKPVIVITGNAENRSELKDSLIAKGATEVVYKPANLATLTEAIDRCLAN